MPAVLFAIKHWEHYLLNGHFIIRIDHIRLKYLTEQKLNTPTQQAWLVKMQHYDFEIHYKKGAKNLVVDALSMSEIVTTSAVVGYIILDQLMEGLKSSWTEDPVLQKIITELKQDPYSNSNYSWQQEELRRKGKLVVGNFESLKNIFI